MTIREISFLFSISFALFALVPVGMANAGVIDELREKIADHSKSVEELEREIKTYQEEILRAGKQAATLTGALRELQLTEEKLAVDIRLTNQKVSRTSLTIEKIKLDIETSKIKIGMNSEVLANALRSLHELESRSFVEILLSHRSISSFWSEVARIGQFQGTIREYLAALKQFKKETEAQKEALEQEHKNLVTLQDRLSDQKYIVDINQGEKNRLLQETKNREANYATLLEERLARKVALEREIAEFEAQIQIEIDPGTLPPTGTGILSWPLQSVFITQYFGNTPFASKNPQVYNNQGHNGVDFRASRGTPVFSAGEGIVRAVGDTDRECYGVSYGRWVLVDHSNGLATLYAHLDLIKVEPKRSVGRGDLLGYSGNTGYTTGPHLHFAVFAARGVQVIERRSRVCGTNLTIPVSPIDGYLNPLSYLPALES